MFSLLQQALVASLAWFGQTFLDALDPAAAHQWHDRPRWPTSSTGASQQ